MRVTEWTDKWIEALRSGRYEQASGRLVQCDTEGKPEGYCCLGVGADVMGMLESASYSNTLGVRGVHGSFAVHCLPQNAAAQLGLDGADLDRLTRMNDSLGWDFNQIADAIEAAKTTGHIARPYW